jgi:hypothetical protein
LYIFDLVNKNGGKTNRQVKRSMQATLYKT